jgi:hypothetical protein
MTPLEQEYPTERLPLNVLVPNENNPNKMAPREFDLLVDNLQQTGFTEPVLVVPIGDTGKYRIYGGHHRVQAAQYLGLDRVPCVIVPETVLSEEMQDFQLLRMNVIHGKTDPQAFLKLYQKHEGTYGPELLQEMFGFSDDAEWKRLVDTTAKSLPKEMQSKFKEAAAEVKTVDGLAQILNKLFTLYGDTLPFGYMVFDYGGSDGIWLRMEKHKKTKAHFEVLAEVAIENGMTLDDMIAVILSRIAKGDEPGLVQAILDECPKKKLPGNLITLPTKDNIANAEAA